MAREPGAEPSIHSEDTATEVSGVPAEASCAEDDVIAKLKSYATKVIPTFQRVLVLKISNYRWKFNQY